MHEIAEQQYQNKRKKACRQRFGMPSPLSAINTLQSTKAERRLVKINRRSGKFFRRFIFFKLRLRRSGLRREFPNSLFRMAISVFRLCVGNKERKRKPCISLHCAFVSFVSATCAGVLPVWSAVTSSRRLLLFDREICNVLSVCLSWSSLQSILYPTFPPCIPSD